jgi:hypothetical protein
MYSSGGCGGVGRTPRASRWPLASTKTGAAVGKVLAFKIDFLKKIIFHTHIKYV